ncbi:metallophosphoesterase family protein [Ornithinimicrobium pekingense]|uniref:metallophosphoesterase family protein n=1 Tax=Ornithinimicrobium pekingense TaxID=384677 RepID=UPI0004922BFD|nr:exonuclease SbcCD subunit D [Ornithinimicrobium pekingense]
MVRFLHTADWQIGMTRRFLSSEAQPRFSQSRVDVIRRLGRVAQDQACAFVVVCGDVFESNQLTPQTVRRALEALRSVPVPVYLLPGNHDPLDAMSVYTSAVFREEAPEHVHVLDGPGPHRVAPGVELVAAPWGSKHPGRDLVAEALSVVDQGPAPAGTVRVVVGHGAVDELDPDRRNPASISTGPLRAALDEGQIHYVALGDRHSRTQVGDRPGIHYSGAPEATAWREERPGDVLVVEVEPGAEVRVTPHHVGTWSFHLVQERLGSDADLDALDARLRALPDKDRAVVRLALRGELTVAQHARLEEVCARHRDTLAALDQWGRHTDLAVLDDGTDWEDLGLGGFLATAVEEIRASARPVGGAVDEDGAEAEAEAEGAGLGVGEDRPGLEEERRGEEAAREPFRPGRDDDETSARDALALLYRLTRGGVA